MPSTAVAAPCACLPDLAVAAAFNSEQSFFAVGVREMHQWNDKNA
jgi:hypothetical protein